MLQWKGHPVPWVARWTGEVDQTSVSVGIERATGITVAFYEDGIENRDEHGVLWHREGINRTGTPQFGEVSVYRQRAAMRHRLCQVCGEKIEGRLIRWLLHPAQIVERNGKTITMSPPTCDPCIELSKAECPAMKRERVIAKVLDYEPWGVYGTVVRMNDAGDVQTTGRTYIEYDRKDFAFDYRAVIAKQQIVEWTKFIIEEN